LKERENHPAKKWNKRRKVVRVKAASLKKNLEKN